MAVTFMWTSSDFHMECVLPSTGSILLELLHNISLHLFAVQVFPSPNVSFPMSAFFNLLGKFILKAGLGKVWTGLLNPSNATSSAIFPHTGHFSQQQISHNFFSYWLGYWYHDKNSVPGPRVQVFKKHQLGAGTGRSNFFCQPEERPRFIKKTLKSGKKIHGGLQEGSGEEERRRRRWSGGNIKRSVD